MTEHGTDVEERLDRAVGHAVPDVLDNILAACGSQAQAEIAELPVQPRKTGRPAARRLVSIAAALALIIVGAFAFSEYQAAYAVESVVSFGADEIVSLDINRKNEVIAVRPAQGADGVVDGLELVGRDVSEATRLVASSLRDKGYGLTEYANVSVDTKSAERRRQLESAVTTEVAAVIKDAVGDAAQSAIDAVDGILDDVGAAASEAGKAAEEIISGAGEAAGEIVSGVGEAAGEIVSGIGEAAGDMADGAGEAASGAVHSLIDEIGSFISSLFPQK